MEIRRIVTGHDAAGRAVVLQDGGVAGHEIPGGAARFALVWKTVSSPVDNDDAADRSGEPTGLAQPGGSVLRVVDLAPGSRSPMHRTNSLDYGIVLAGTVELELDVGCTTRVNAGDIVVQRGTIHAWINPGPTTARMAFVLIDARPATVGGAPLAPVDP
jgi:quercetin dioxygenase-like cupin family protein